MAIAGGCARVAFVALVGCAGAAVGIGCGPRDDGPRTEGVRRDDAVFEDLGRAPKDAPARALLVLRVRDEAALASELDAVYDPTSPRFRRFVGAEEVARRFGPSAESLNRVVAWSERAGFRVVATSQSRLVLAVETTVFALERAFSTRVRLYRHRTRQTRALGTEGGVSLPADVPELLGLAALDIPQDGELAPEGASRDGDALGDDALTALEGVGFTPAQISSAYGLSELARRGERGRGARIGIVAGGAVRESDVTAFFRAFDVPRAPIRVRVLIAPAPIRVIEATSNVEWAGVLAPDADIVVFQGPDAQTSSVLFAFVEAATSGEVDVVSTSYTRNESSEPVVARTAYDVAARMAALAGTSVVAASGNSGRPNVPATCPYVTAVGGTSLSASGAGGGFEERAWERSGSGESMFPSPAWQRRSIGAGDRRLAVDVALNAGAPYAVLYRGEWRSIGGTSLATPTFAAILAVLHGARSRTDAERARIGCLNAMLYGDTAVQRAFRDIAVGATSEHEAAIGWDPPTGWGAPDATKLLEALP
jgi:kumamolisin